MGSGMRWGYGETPLRPMSASAATTSQRFAPMGFNDDRENGNGASAKRNKRLVVLYAPEEKFREARQEEARAVAAAAAASPRGFGGEVSSTSTSRCASPETGVDNDDNDSVEAMSRCLARNVLLGNACDVVIGAQYDRFGNRTVGGRLMSASETRRASIIEDGVGGRGGVGLGVKCPIHLVDRAKPPRDETIRATSARRKRTKAPPPPQSPPPSSRPLSPNRAVARGIVYENRGREIASNSPRSARPPFMHSPTSPVDFIKYEVQSRVIAGGTSLPPQKLISRDRTTGVVTTIVHPMTRSKQLPTRRRLVADDVASTRAPGPGGRGTKAVDVTGKSARVPRIESARHDRPLSAHHASQRSRPISARTRSVRVPHHRTPTVEEKVLKTAGQRKEYHYHPLFNDS